MFYGPIAMVDASMKPFHVRWLAAAIAVFVVGLAVAAEAPVVPLRSPQPLLANTARVIEALEFLGAPLDQQAAANLKRATIDGNSERVQQLLDVHALLIVTI